MEQSTHRGELLILPQSGFLVRLVSIPKRDDHVRFDRTVKISHPERPAEVGQNPSSTIL